MIVYKTHYSETPQFKVCLGNKHFYLLKKNRKGADALHTVCLEAVGGNSLGSERF